MRMWAKPKPQNGPGTCASASFSVPSDCAKRTQFGGVDRLDPGACWTDKTRPTKVEGSQKLR
jgi:hypothetical protein